MTIKVEVEESGIGVTVEEVGLGITVTDKGARGEPGIVWKGTWSAISDYYVGDAVEFSTRSYICKKFISSSASNTPIAVTDSWDVLIGMPFSNWYEDPTSGDLLPNGNETLSIGSPTLKIKDLHLAGSTIHLGDSEISSEGGDIKLPSVILGSGDNTIKLGVSESGKLSQESTVGGEVQPTVEGVDSVDVNVTSHNNLPSGNLQDALHHLEDQIYQQTAAPIGSNLSEGDLWYDLTTDRMNVYRDNTWEILVTSPALSDDTGYDNISMNGGYF
jgi:hypothetical protein